MAPRLLTLLGLIETALVNQGSPAVSMPPSRTVSFHKGMARMHFMDDSGSITLQNYTLADGQICVRATFGWSRTTETGTHSIYPREDFDWLAAAEQIATAWLSGRPMVKATDAEPDGSLAEASEKIEAAG